ncbi:MAG: hypothetical protein LH617_12590 [Ramlibacter sp.]|nr:hypothetical protein [Ramlibacter sp.]
MSATSKIVGLIAGVSAVAAIGVAVAQGVPPNPYIANPALGAGQQSSHMTSMGETGVPGLTEPVRTAIIVRQPEVAYVAPAPVFVQAPMPAPAPVIAAQVEATPAPAQTMGAAPMEPAQAPARMRVARADRN